MKRLLLCLLLAGCGGTNVPGDEDAARAECALHEGLIWWETSNMSTRRSDVFSNWYTMYIHCRDHTMIQMERKL